MEEKVQNNIVDPDDNTRPIILAKRSSNGKQFTVFVDTGSPRNIITRKTYETLFSDMPLELDEVPSLAGVTGSKIIILGRFSLKFEIGQIQFLEKVYVAENIKLAGMLLLGDNTIKKYFMRREPEGIRIWDKLIPHYDQDELSQNIELRNFHITTRRSQRVKARRVGKNQNSHPIYNLKPHQLENKPSLAKEWLDIGKGILISGLDIPARSKLAIFIIVSKQIPNCLDYFFS
ncbi:MAG: hypothetical protein AAGK97_07390 [Bacteroidota bacterium]